MSRRRRRRGVALLAVLVFLTAGLAFVALQQRHISMAIASERTAAVTDTFREGAVVAASRGVTLLETGDPPSDPYTCQTTVATTNGSATFEVSFVGVSANQWSVSVAPMGPSLLPNMPGSF